MSYFMRTLQRDMRTVNVCETCFFMKRGGVFAEKLCGNNWPNARKSFPTKCERSIWKLFAGSAWTSKNKSLLRSVMFANCQIPINLVPGNILYPRESECDQHDNSQTWTWRFSIGEHVYDFHALTKIAECVHFGRLWSKSFPIGSFASRCNWCPGMSPNFSAKWPSSSIDRN